MRLRVSRQLQIMNRSTDLTREEITRVQTSFDRMWPRSAVMVDLFYDRLFEILPETRPMFRGDMVQLKHKFIATLAVIVGSLDNITGLLSVIGKLAKDHVHYGVLETHYAPVGEALFWSLEQGLGPHWTPDVEEAWQKVYTFLSARMISAAYQ
jgi:hemoglobin-like flavoprotein